ncbi:NACHT domain-containing NTPase [Nonomuraea sp. NEAU-A123]|uniref:NACHT domain-containing protein n=1 Tax=Nonomuraea sp. NEAU-A123 TaxID=2839649 RepID=UPI001BE412FE|nr:hypothetical protein [Nonomuraea sp. NEAU-A123]MBT2224849.1 hypothetical protein [Nonomuraea sp. NEAU-A123]
MGEARDRHPLHRELVRLEERAKRPGRYSRKKLLDELHDERNGPKLSPQTVSGWMARGLVPDEFADMWAFARELLRRTSASGPESHYWWVRKENEFRGLWEAAKKEAAHRAADRAFKAEAALSEELIDFLNATRVISVEHPYPAVLPGATLPPLSQVYVRQQAELQRADKSERDSDQSRIAWDRRPAEDIIKGEAPMTWLLGGPGAGKSSLLRIIVITLTGQRLDDDKTQAPQKPRRTMHPGVIHTLSSEDSRPHDKPLVPVYIPAHTLTRSGSFTQQLANAIHSQFKGHVYVPPSEEFFRSPPYPGARWLILIDGLDEIADIDERLRVLRALNSNKDGIYRFIIGSRPLPESELAILDEEITVGRTERKIGPAGRYELLPLDVNELPTFVRGWMEVARVPDPALAVAAFMDQVNSGRLRELARNPLMATILCQLHAADPAHPLPKGRYAAYQRFYELLNDRFYDRSSAGINHQLDTQLRRYGTQSAAAINDLPSGILGALGQAAFHQQDERASRSLEQIKTNVSCLRPQDMPASRWDALIAQVLRRTGLVVIKVNDLAFIHQTLGEFLAAKYAACDTNCSEEELFRLTNQDGVRSFSYLTSYDRFLIAAWIAEDRRPSGLHDLMLKLSASFSSAAGIAELIRDGIDLPKDVRESVTGTLRKMASGRDLSTAIVAAENLASLDLPSAVEVLSIVLRSPRISFLDRARLSKKIIEFDPLRAVDVFAELSMTRQLNIMYRDLASDYLIELDQARASSVISEMIRERTGNVDELIVLTNKLAKLDNRLAITIMTDIMSHCTWKEAHHLRLLEWLTGIRGAI